MTNWPLTVQCCGSDDMQFLGISSSATEDVGSTSLPFFPGASFDFSTRTAAARSNLSVVQTLHRRTRTVGSSPQLAQDRKPHCDRPLVHAGWLVDAPRGETLAAPPETEGSAHSQNIAS